MVTECLRQAQTPNLDLVLDLDLDLVLVLVLAKDATPIPNAKRYYEQNAVFLCDLYYRGVCDTHLQ